MNIAADGAKSALVQWTDASVPQPKKYAAADLSKTTPLDTPENQSPVGEFALFEELAEVCRSRAK